LVREKKKEGREEKLSLGTVARDPREGGAFL